MGEAAREIDPGALMMEAVSQAVAQAMIPVRQEINAGIRQLGHRMDKLDERVGNLETDVAQLKTDVAEIKQILQEKL